MQDTISTHTNKTNALQINNMCSVASQRNIFAKKICKLSCVLYIHILDIQ